jgi:hypothetical protein
MRGPSRSTVGLSIVAKEAVMAARRKSMRKPLMFVLATATAVACLAASAAPAQAQGALVFRLGPEGGCEVGPTDIPGVPVDIPANCLFLVTPSGNAMILVRAQIPAGFALSETFVAQDVPCFFPGVGPGSGSLVATTGGQITARCSIQA